MSKSSANPRRYSRGKEALNPVDACVVYVELRVPATGLANLDAQLKYFQSRHPQAVVEIAGMRREASQFVVTVGVDMGPIRQALRGTSVRVAHGYRMLWEIWVQLPEALPVFASPPGQQDTLAARAWTTAHAERSAEANDTPA